MAKNSNNYVGLPVGTPEIPLGHPDEMHVTLIYMGNFIPRITAVPIFNRFANYASRVPVIGAMQVGEDPLNPKEALALEPLDWMVAARNQLIEAGCRDVSKYQPWRPHVTLKKPMKVIPPHVTVWNPYISIRGQRISF